MSKQKGGRTTIYQQTPKSIKTGFSRSDKNFQWDFSLADWNHAGWKDPEITLEYFVQEIISKLKDFETQTWHDVETAAGGRGINGGSNSHSMPATDLPRNEKRWFIAQGYMGKYDRVFSLRLTGLKRLIGIVDGVVFKIIWFDKNHNVFPSHRND